ncbi:hypothetical protein OSB04_un001489 [Centaurea solstitialis]|uniref:Reverse transcriptase domain-containing protein n=1 Tax=Centaurea solstitialis TaxID=347529 RepID=A0AA38W2K5_9ASTR|nr:hypothetical protein OSB04_un001489 [Centaurea solstitialis]
MVKVGVWNVRGLNMVSKRREVKRLIVDNGLEVCSVVETKVCRPRLKPICDEIFGNWSWVSNNSVCEGRTRIIIGWDSSKINLDVVAIFPQVIHVHICEIDSKRWFHCSFIYAANDVVSRRDLWDRLLLHKGVVKSEPWILMGDFNVGLNPGDSSRGSSKVSRGMQDFRDCVNDLEMEDINQKGLMFTWVQKPMSDVGGTGLLKKLDRVLGNLFFMEAFPSAFASFLPWNLSDHSPVILLVPNLTPFKQRPFKFLNFWTENPNFLPLVDDAWVAYIKGCCMFSLVSKMKIVKKGLRKLHKEHGDVFEKVRNLRLEVDQVQRDIDCDPENGDLRVEGAVFLKSLKDALFDEECFLRQRSKVQWLREGDSNTAYFHSVVKSRVNKGRINEVEDLDGNRFMGAAVPQQFVKHFERMLGSEEGVEPIIEPDDLFVNKISSQHAEFMIRPVEDTEIRDAIFDIDELKAPGPDGFSSRFFKKAWPIVGKEVCDAVKEFFYNGKLLGEVNATVLTLVPKSQSPKNVADFRPIACCNVIYKCISKILVGRIKDCLNVLVDANQSAFIPNRHIGDNVLLAQELMRGYHRQRGASRCAFKIDIQKAYDTVNWCFLEEILRRFGFHPCMVSWLMKCVSSASFTIRVNGEHHGFFPGKRGIRQGDPLSPYLFTLVMEVLTLMVKRKVQSCPQFRFHPKCEKLGLTHLCFADDLLMFCYGNVHSVNVLKDALMEFSVSSGLKPSMGKSTSFLGNVFGFNREEIMKVLPFQLGKLPVRYLGVPLISTKLFHRDCLSLIDKVRRRTMEWRNKWLSFAGRLQLVNSVLSSISVYWSSMFLLPVSVVKEIERILRAFLWSGGEAIKGKAKVAWSIVCLPRSKGGLGVKSLKLWNKILLSKQIWKIIDNGDSLWVKWLHTYRLKDRNFWDVGEVHDASWFWRKMVRIRDAFRFQLVHKIGDGKSTSLWFDNWHPSGPLCYLISKRELYEARVDLNLKVSDIVCDGNWLWPIDVWCKYGHILQAFQPALKDHVRDKVLWRNQNGHVSDFHVGAVWIDNFNGYEDVSWAKLIWYSQGIPRHAFFLWLAIRERLRTLDRMLKWRVTESNVCVLCSDALESHCHLFVECSYSKEVWRALEGFIGVYDFIVSGRGGSDGWRCLIEELSKVKMGNSIWSIIHRLVFAAVIYFLWQERNKRIHTAVYRSEFQLARQVIELIKMKLMGLKVKPNSHVKRAAEIWDLEVRNGGFHAKIQFVLELLKLFAAIFWLIVGSDMVDDVYDSLWCFKSHTLWYQRVDSIWMLFVGEGFISAGLRLMIMEMLLCSQWKYLDSCWKEDNWLNRMQNDWLFGSLWLIWYQVLKEWLMHPVKWFVFKKFRNGVFVYGVASIHIFRHQGADEWGVIRWLFFCWLLLGCGAGYKRWFMVVVILTVVWSDKDDFLWLFGLFAAAVLVMVDIRWSVLWGLKGGVYKCKFVDLYGADKVINLRRDYPISTDWISFDNYGGYRVFYWWSILLADHSSIIHIDSFWRIYQFGMQGQFNGSCWVRFDEGLIWRIVVADWLGRFFDLDRFEHSFDQVEPSVFRFEMMESSGDRFVGLRDMRMAGLCWFFPKHVLGRHFVFLGVCPS